ncbi:hypothetical protein [uncultured Fibrella sp.]|uniref:hypothetical protein n=1 Tax=uncultured Fibrella sp. TaxID=1284596 RepID=UPI0035CACD29
MQNKDSIHVPISPAPFTVKARIATHRFFGITENLNMIQQVDVSYTDEAGKPMHEVIDGIESLTPIQKELAKAQYPDRMVSKTTEAAWCNPATGAVVPAGTEGAISQLQFFQSITVEQMLVETGKNLKSGFAEVLYTVLAGEILKIDARGEL